MYLFTHLHVVTNLYAYLSSQLKSNIFYQFWYSNGFSSHLLWLFFLFFFHFLSIQLI